MYSEHQRSIMRVIIESPYGSDDPEVVERNIVYARRCLRDSLSRGEYPFASHLLYPLVLDDRVPAEREMGIRGQLVWMLTAHLVAVYEDYGETPGMFQGESTAKAMRIPIVRRKIGVNPSEEVSVS